MRYNRYTPPDFEHGEIPGVGIVLANLGTPDAPTSGAVRRYLRSFLSDPRVVELPRVLWWPILYLFVLAFRPRRSAALYRAVWTDEGSPLMMIARRQRSALEAMLRGRYGGPIHVELGMVYGSPSIIQALSRLRAKGCRRVLFLPAYPQYSGSTTGSALDVLFAELRRWRWVPELRTVTSYHDDPGYVEAVARSVRELWDREGEPDKLLFSFHGVPQRYVDNGDPYQCYCYKTARLVTEGLGIDRSRSVIAFQSQFGREEWIKPSTDVTIRELAGAGVTSLDVISPGFSADCLETLEELDIQNRGLFEESGGQGYRYIPCLNDRQDHIEALASLVAQKMTDWLVPLSDWDTDLAERLASESRERAAAMQRAGVEESSELG